MAEQKFTIGQDSTVELKSKSDITLKLADYNGNVIATEPTGYQLVEGSDVVATMPKVSYYVTAHITAGSYDGVEYADGDYRFELKQLKATGNTTLAPVNTYQWVCTTEGYSRNATAAEIEQFGLTGDNPQISMVLALENADFAYTSENAMPAGTASIYGIKVWQKVEGVTDAIDITETYQTKYTTTDTTNQAVNAGFFAENDKAHTITFANYANAGIVRTDETHIIGNGTTSALGIYVTPVEVFGAEVEGGNDKFYGSKLNETAVSTSADEDFDLGTGRDAITFEKKSGVDTITLNPDEELTLSFDAGATVQHNVVGDDVVLTADVKYYVTAKATADFTYDGLEYKKDQVYTFEAKKLTQSGKEGLVDTYQWLGTYTRKANAGENGPVGMVLETSDVEAGAITNVNDGGTGVRLGEITVYKSVNGGEGVAVTGFNEAETAYNAQISNDVTIKNFAKQDIGATVTLAGDDLANNYTYAAAVSQDKKNITGSRLNDVATSTSLDEKFDLGASVGNTNKDEITFAGHFGNDTVTLNEGENLNLLLQTADKNALVDSFRRYIKKTTSGNDVVLTAENTLTLTATVTTTGSQSGKVDGFTVKPGEYTLKLAKSGSVGAQPNKYMFQLTPSYNTGEEEAHYVYVYLTKDDFNVDGEGNVLSIKDQPIDGITLTNCKLTHTTALGSYDYGQYYYNAVKNKTVDEVFTYAQGKFNEEISGTITIKGLAAGEISGATATVITSDGTDPVSTNVEDYTYTPNVDKTGKIFTGSRLNEGITGTANNETFNLKGGDDFVWFDGSFGKDTVVLANNERLMLNIVGNTDNSSWTPVYANPDALSYSMSKNDLVITAEDKYELKATVTTTGSQSGKVDGFTVKPGEYTLRLAESGSVGAQPNKFMFQLTPSYNTGEEEAHYVYVYLTKDDFNVDATTGAVTIKDQPIDGITLTNCTLTHTTAQGGTVDFAKTYYTASLEDGFNAFNYAKSLYQTEVSGTITVKDYTKSEGKLLINADSYTDPGFVYEVTANKKNIFTGTNADDVATSTGANETFDLKAGNDKIVFNGKFGDDIVKLTAGENLNLAISDPAKFELKGNDLLVTTQNNIKLIGTVAAGAKVDGFDVAAGQYTMELVKSGSVGEQANKFMFQLTPNYNGDAAEKHYVYYYLTADDFTVDGEGNVTAINDQVWAPSAGTSITLTGLQLVNETVNGNVNYAQTYYDGLANVGAGKTYATVFEYAEALAAGEGVNTITLKDYVTKANTVDVTVNGAADARISNLFKVTPADIPESGKIAPKGNADNNIDAFGFVASPDGKGVTVTTGKGNDTITGSLFNDTIKTMGGENSITEKGGTNKITLGKGGSRLMLQEGSSNTVTAKGGENTVALDSYGTNKVTLGAGDDHITVTAGVNNVKAGAGTNDFTVNGTPAAGNEVSNNTYTGGKGVDIVTLNAEKAVNKISAGAGADAITIANGYNTVDGGKGNDAFLVIGGKNILKGGAGTDAFVIQGGNSAINGGAGADLFMFDNNAQIIASVNGAKGNDVYDFSDFTFNGDDSTISIVDTAGKNTLNLSGVEADYDVWFDVSFNKKGKAVASKTLIVQDSDDADQKFTFKTDGKLAKKGAAKGKLANLTVNIGSSTYKVDVKAVTNAVASWLKSEAAGDFTSAADVFKNGSDDQIQALAAIYEDNIFKA